VWERVLLRLSFCRELLGYYAFGGIKKGTIAAIHALQAGRDCAPRRGPAMELQANEVEVDINLGKCP
jgi:hypothetical protein